LIADFLRGRWLPIVGAGYSRNAELRDGISIPDWRGLGDALAAELTDFEPQNTIDAISGYEEEHGRTRLIETMTELLHISDAEPGKAHEALCRAGFDLILTTNFDFLLERAYQAIGQPCQPLLSESQLPQRPLTGQAQLLKLHGDLNHPDELIASEEDFDAFLSRHPLKATFAANLLITRTPVLLGYSFDDPDTRSLWALIRDRLGSLHRKGYALLVNPSSTEIARFARRNISVVALRGDDHAEAFADLFDQLRVRYVEEVATVSKPTEDEVAAELVLPADAPSRLCFCSVPVKLLAWYRSEIFPVIEAAGYVAVTREDVLSPGDNSVATVNALLARASLALVDGSSFSTGHELGMALAALPPERVLVIIDDSHAIPAAFRVPLDRAHVSVLRREDEPAADAQDLVARLKARLNEIPPVTSQPQTLLTQGHTNAAVAVAFGMLEQELTDRAEALRGERPPGIMRLTQWAREAGIMSEEDHLRFKAWVDLRNRAVHDGQTIDAATARRVVSEIEDFLTDLG
jgi:hypothetical protein